MIESFAQLGIIAAASFSVYALASLGFLLIYIPAKFFNFTAAVPVLLTPYIAYAVIQRSGSFALGCLISLAAAGILGGFLYQVVFRRLGASGYSATIQLVATLGIYTAAVGVIGLIFGQQSVRIDPFESEAILLPLEIRVSFAQALSIGTAAAAILCFHVVWRRTEVGLRLRAMADDMILARILSIPVSRYAMFAFAAGFVLLGLAGVLGGFDSALRPTFAFPLVVVAMVAAAVGQGNARFAAALAASAVIAIAETAVAWYAGEAWARPVSLVCLIVILVWAGTQRRNSLRQV